jgi:hypothetical protein
MDCQTPARNLLTVGENTSKSISMLSRLQPAGTSSALEFARLDAESESSAHERWPDPRRIGLALVTERQSSGLRNRQNRKPHEGRRLAFSLAASSFSAAVKIHPQIMLKIPHAYASELTPQQTRSFRPSRSNPGRDLETNRKK